MAYKVALIDIDNATVDTDQHILIARHILPSLAESFGYRDTRDHLSPSTWNSFFKDAQRNYFGESPRRLVEHAFPPCENANRHYSVKSFHDALAWVYECTFPGSLQVVEPMEEFLDYLHSEGLKVVAFSNAPPESTREKLELVNLDDKFSAIYGPQGRVMKPNPKMYEQVLMQEGVRADECLVHDDLPENLVIPLLSGMGVIFPNWGLNPVNLSQWNVPARYASYAELVKKTLQHVEVKRASDLMPTAKKVLSSSSASLPLSPEGHLPYTAPSS